mmetsp:Transcript_21739/g.65036  ORF Transcript_21739/g.65036 Transcript_21739/m.65036 type:complete len:208 (+) Transcript_21739:856-1479(+)
MQQAHSAACQLGCRAAAAEAEARSSATRAAGVAQPATPARWAMVRSALGRHHSTRTAAAAASTCLRPHRAPTAASPPPAATSCSPSFRATNSACFISRLRAASRSTRTIGARAHLRTPQRTRGGATRASSATAPSRALTTSRAFACAATRARSRTVCLKAGCILLGIARSYARTARAATARCASLRTRCSSCGRPRLCGCRAQRSSR